MHVSQLAALDGRLHPDIARTSVRDRAGVGPPVYARAGSGIWRRDDRVGVGAGAGDGAGTGAGAGAGTGVGAGVDFGAHRLAPVIASFIF